MINKSKGKLTKKIPGLNTLKILIRSLKNQFQKLDSVNKNIDNLNSELQGSSYQKKGREKVKKFAPNQV